MQQYLMSVSLCLYVEIISQHPILCLHKIQKSSVQKSSPLHYFTNHNFSNNIKNNQWNQILFFQYWTKTYSFALKKYPFSSLSSLSPPQPPLLLFLYLFLTLFFGKILK